MKYIITESQFNSHIEHLKAPMFRYWDMNGPKDYKFAMKLFSIPPAGSTLVQDWLLEWMGGSDELYRMINKYSGKVFRGVAGTYDFKFYFDNVRIYTHEGVEIYFDVTVDGDGSVEVEYDGHVFNNIYDLNQEEDIAWEVEDEIKDIIWETLEDVINFEFDTTIDVMYVTPPGKF